MQLLIVSSTGSILFKKGCEATSEYDADMPTIAVEEGNLDTTTSMPSSEYFDEYEFNHPHPDSIYNKSNVTEKMSKDFIDNVTQAESLSSMSSTRSGQLYLQSTSKSKLSYDIFIGDEIIMKVFFQWVRTISTLKIKLASDGSIDKNKA